MEGDRVHAGPRQAVRGRKLRGPLALWLSRTVEVCKDRSGEPMTDYPRPVAERCLARFVWWGSPYGTGACDADPRKVWSPADYLVTYWMGRYYGFIEPES